MSEVILDVTSVTKKFPGVTALDNVKFNNLKGEIHALVGENGAGKSTLIKIIAGVYEPEGGALTYNGTEAIWKSPHDSQKEGINVIYQEFNSFPELTVKENIYIGREPVGRQRVINDKEMEKGSKEILRKFGITLDLNIKLKHLSIAEQQMVEIAKAMVNQTRLLILDEPTAVLSVQDAEALFRYLLLLKEEGVSIIYITHRLDEVFQIADRVTVLKDGCVVDTVETHSIERNQLVSMMVGRDIEDIYPSKAESVGKEVLKVEHLSIGNNVKNIDLSLHSGEVLGLAGLVGSRRTDLVKGIFGGMPISDGCYTISGGCLLEPKKIASTSPNQAIDHGIGFLTEDRKREGLFLGHSVLSNITVSTLKEFLKKFGFIKNRTEEEVCNNEIQTYNISAPNCSIDVGNLSGGNQQKVLFARWARACKGILILDEPTRGVDVGAKVEIYRIIRQLADQGIGILMISSELPEIVGMCDRVIVMREGRVAGELEKDKICEEEIMHLATMNSEDIPNNGTSV